MRDRKKRFEVFAMLLVGAGFVVYGMMEMRASKRLATAGDLGTATVLNKSVYHGVKQRKDYYLEVRFVTKGGQTVEQRSEVSQGMFERAKRGDNVPVIYMPDKPELFQLGRKVNPNCSRVLLGLLFMAIAAFHQLFGRGSARSGQSGQE
jgi:hypothetical protein